MTEPTGTKKVRVRMIAEYDVMVPVDWDEDMVEFHRNESSWCADSALEELKDLSSAEGSGGCLCSCVRFEAVKDD